MSTLSLSLTNPLITSLGSPAAAFRPNRTRQILGGIAGNVANIVVPGSGPVVRSAIGGGGVPADFQTSTLMDQMREENMNMIAFQYQINQESRKYEVAANVGKARHDSNMNAIRNMKS